MEINSFQTFIQRLEIGLKQPLPGISAQFKMVPPTRSDYPEMDPATVRHGGILALLFPDEDATWIVFIKRQDYQGVHSGQISFPGGGYEENDQNFQQTAIRETFEEIGVPMEEIVILGELSQLYIPPSKFLVRPFVGFIDRKPSFRPDPTEVSEVFSIPVDKLLATENCQKKTVRAGTGEITVPCFYVKNRLIWGATAMILSELLDIIRSVNVD